MQDQDKRDGSAHRIGEVGAHHGSSIAFLETALEPPSSTSLGTASEPGVRIHSLDYVRGIFALGVMLCHYLSINGIDAGLLVNQSMARIGAYCVCGFYVLSGMSLGLVYARRTMDRAFLTEFAIKRVFRIVPLFWLVITLTVCMDAIPALLSGGQPDWYDARRLLLNYSLLFAWVNPADSIPMGGWSIGVEMVFYAFFPLILVLARHAMQTAVLAVCLAVAPAAVFAFDLLRPAADISGQWGLYVNPLNHLFLFVIGIVLAVRRPTLPVSRRLLAFALPGLVVAFLVFPAGGNIYCGWNRLVLSTLVILICWVVLEWKAGVGRLAPLLEWVGWISYGVYLLHPICFRMSLQFVAYPLRRNPMLISWVVGGAATLVAATLSWVYFEKPMMRLGRSLIGRMCRDSYSTRSPDGIGV